MNILYKSIMDCLEEKTNTKLKSSYKISDEMSEKIYIIPPRRTRYLSEIAENNRAYDEDVENQVKVAQRLYGIYTTLVSTANAKTIQLNSNGIDEEDLASYTTSENNDFIKLLKAEFDKVKMDLNPYNWEKILEWDNVQKRYQDDIYSFKVRDKEIKIETHTESLSHLKIPKVALPKYQAWGRFVEMDVAGKCAWRISIHRRFISI